jgi:hypothetical protein
MKKADRGESGPPILSDAEWRALKNICADVKKAGGVGAERSGGRTP